MRRIKGLLRRFTRPFLYLAFKPFLRILGYKHEPLNLGLPESIYFKDEDTLRSIRRLHQEYLRDTGWIESKMQIRLFAPVNTYHGRVMHLLTGLILGMFQHK